MLLLFCGCISMHAQNTIRISGGTKVTINGNVQVSLGTSNLVNNGVLSGTTGSLVFAGAVNYSGTGTTQVQNFLVTHTSGTSVLNAPIGITNKASILFGNLDSKNDNLILRSDLSSTANLTVMGTPIGSVQGLVAKASISKGPCPSFNSVLSVNITGPALLYQWQSSTDSLNWSNISGATAHDYAATISSAIYYRCRITANASNFDELAFMAKIFPDTSVTTISGITTIAAGNTSVLTSVTAGGVWSTGNDAVLTVNPTTGLITGISAGSATIIYKLNQSIGCSSTSTTVINVTVNTTKPIVKITNPAAFCAPATADLTAAVITAGSDAGLTYTYFTDAAGTITLTAPDKAVAGTYYIKGTNNSNIASDLMPVVVTTIQVQGLKAGFTFNSYCINNAVLFTNTSTPITQLSYQWSDNTGKTSTAASPSFTFTQTGTVNMKLKISSVTCPLVTDSITQSLVIEQPVTAIRMPLVNVGVNESTALQARTFAGASYTWAPITGLSNTLIYNPAIVTASEQDYKISIKAPSGCITVDSLLVRIFDKRIYVPNAFTPNGDGVNDKLFVNIIGTGIRTLSYFRVYNRFSRLVFETTNAGTGWDGTVNGALQPIDTYLWVAEAKDVNGTSIIRRGNVSLLR
ncbi:MAG: gliding motility-associated C-terminal domain-containing protein [Bacteroidota bacterium]